MNNHHRKRWSIIPTLFLFVLLCVSLISSCVTLPPTQETDNTLTVQGRGSITVKPDRSILSISVRSESGDAVVALSDNNLATRTLLALLIDFGVDPTDIRTQDFNVWKNGGKGNSLSIDELNTVVNNSVVVTVRDIDKMGALLDAITQAGSYLISSIEFDLADKTEIMREARKQAMTNAGLIAEELAADSSLKLGPIINITYVDDPLTKIDNYKGAEGRGNTGIQIFSGKMTVSTNVTVTYQVIH